MLRSLLLVAFLALYLYSSAQKKPVNRQSISFELGKTGIIFNLIYDHAFSKYGFRLGAGSNFNTYLRAITIGGGGFYLFGKEHSFFETGAELNYLVVEENSDDQSTTLLYPDYETKTFLATINLGYRHYSKKILFRTGISPGITKTEFIPGGYIRIGFFF